MSARILEKGERADSLYGREYVFITRHDLSELANGKRLYITVNMEYAIVVKVLEQPTAEPERKRGKWLKVTDKHGINGETVWRCSSCLKMTICKGDYCPNCGAKMEAKE